MAQCAISLKLPVNFFVKCTAKYQNGDDSEGSDGLKSVALIASCVPLWTVVEFLSMQSVEGD